MVLCAALVTLHPMVRAADAVSVSEDKARALFLANFVKYVDWPAGSLGAANTPVVIGVLGRSGMGDELKTLAKDALVAGHPLDVRILDSGDDFMGCHILFVAAAETKKLGSILGRLQCAPILTVGDDEKFVSAGGMIALVRRDSRIRPQVNLAAVALGGFKLSSKLLAVSDVVRAAGLSLPATP